MKPNINIVALLFLFIITDIIIPEHAFAKQESVNFQVFYDQLSPYGQWIDYSNYGYVWIPDAGSDFVPYSTEGHWIMSDYGWTWVSEYNWGWAPFHYGRWGFDNSLGWFWVPDNEWGPSWVTWRSADGYYGWEPLEPGLTIDISFGRGYNSNNDHWMFVRDRDIERSDINHYYVSRSENERIGRNSRVVNKTYMDNGRHSTYIAGPAKEDVERISGRKINSVAIKDNNKPGQNMNNGQLRIYRPQIDKNNSRGSKLAPAKISNLNDVKRHSEKKDTYQPENSGPSNNDRQDRKQQEENPRNNNAQPGIIQKPNPSENKIKEQEQKSPRQENTDKNTMPRKSQNPNSNENIKQEQRPIIAKPENNDNNKAQPSPFHKPVPSENNRREQHENNATPPNNGNKPQPAQPRNVNPADNNQRQHQPNNATPSNNNHNDQPRENKPERDKKPTN